MTKGIIKTQTQNQTQSKSKQKGRKNTATKTRKSKRVHFEAYSPNSSLLNRDEQSPIKRRYLTLVDKYNRTFEDYKKGTEKKQGVIYRLLENVAKKRYSKNKEVAQFQEAFYKRFMENDEMYMEYDQKLHNHLLDLRFQAEKPKRSRCPNKSRKNKKTGKCEKY